MNWVAHLKRSRGGDKEKRKSNERDGIRDIAYGLIDSKLLELVLDIELLLLL